MFFYIMKTFNVVKINDNSYDKVKSFMMKTEYCQQNAYKYILPYLKSNFTKNVNINNRFIH